MPATLSLPRGRVAYAIGSLGALIAAVLAIALVAAAPPVAPSTPTPSLSPAAGAAPPLVRLAERAPARRVEVIVQLRAGERSTAAESAVRAAGGNTLRALPLINGFAARLSAAAAVRLGDRADVRAVSLNAAVEKTGLVDAGNLATAYNQSIRADRAWSQGATGRGVGVAVVDTGIAGTLPDFRGDEGASRVTASAVVNPLAENAADTLGHGTHVAGLIAGNGTQRAASDRLYGRYAGVAPDATLISVKADDGRGGATVMDVIDALQFVVDFRSELGIRVVNLSLSSTVAESYRTDPLDAAAEATWRSGIVVVAAAGNRGEAADAVSYAPANDPYVITVGAVDDNGTKDIDDDRLASWSSRGTTQDGFAKPDVLAPGARLVSVLSPDSDYASLCPSCVTDGEYFRVGGTSMAAAVVSGAVATIVGARPAWTPDEVKGTLVRRTRAVHAITASDGVLVDGKGRPEPATTTITSTIVGGEVALDKVLSAVQIERANGGLAPSDLLDPATGGIDYTRTSWSRTSWSEAPDQLRASWARTSWSRTSWSRTSWSATPQSCSDLERAGWTRTSWSDAELAAARTECEAMDPTRTSWSRTSWSRTSWSTSFEK